MAATSSKGAYYKDLRLFLFILSVLVNTSSPPIESHRALTHFAF